ncbi:MAG: hypothetical protein J6Y29_02000 [Clostridiales bacterium]|nr:hypothetical protein [Clostridiales bacterium]
MDLNSNMSKPLNLRDIPSNNLNLHATGKFHSKPIRKVPTLKRSHTRHLSLDKNFKTPAPFSNDSLFDRNISFEDLSHTKERSTMLMDKTHLLENSIHNLRHIDNLDISSNVSLTHNALLCLKTLVSPVAIFFHVGRFAITSFSTALSFVSAFALSDVIFFYFLDNFSLSYFRYILLGISGIVGVFSIKGVLQSVLNLFLSVFKGTYSWYFSLVDPECSFLNFLFGINDMTLNDS